MERENRPSYQDDLLKYIDGHERDTTIQEQITYESGQKVDVSFRNLVPEIPKTTYGTFSVYKYPAKFIPQAVAYVLRKYGKTESTIFDPFAGYGTVGLASRVFGYDYELWDLNPLMNVIHDTAIMELPKFPVSRLLEMVKNSNDEFIPKWSRLGYWFPDEFIPMLTKAWGLAHSLDDSFKYSLLIPLLKSTRFFSYSDEKTHKLYKSKFSKAKVRNLLEKNWEHHFYRQLERGMKNLRKKISEYKTLNPRPVQYNLRSGINTMTSSLEQEVDLLITSPPYLQAQEYIRSTKLELYWLGHTDSDIRRLGKMELPYNPVEEIDIQSSLFWKYRKKISEEHMLQVYDRYFHGILGTFSNLGNNVSDRMCIFVGPAKVRGIPIPLDEIIVEHLAELGWKHEVTYIDTIVSRVMFESKVNPATGNDESRMKTEHFAILKRTR